MSNKRVISATVLSAGILILIAADHFLNTTAFFYLGWGLMVALALYEFYSLAGHRGLHPLRALGITAGTLLATVSSPTAFHYLMIRPATLVAVCAGLAVALVIDLIASKESLASLAKPQNVLITIAGIIGVGLLASYLTAVRCMYSGEEAWKSEIMLLVIIMVSKGGDIAAYFTGRKFGRRKLAPRISPGKTQEGAMAGLTASVVIAVLGSFFFADTFIELGPAVLFGLTVGVASQAGDLAESWYKRKMKAKDSSDLLPHYGGILDVIDALLFAAPTSYYFLRLF